MTNWKLKLLFCAACCVDAWYVLTLIIDYNQGK